jgi:urease accessory protein
VTQASDHRLVVLLHLCDSLFPLGAFAHSDGLEAATAAGQVATSSDLREWMLTTRDESLARGEGPAVRVGWDAFSTGALEEVVRVDAELHAMRPSRSLRQASRAMGTRLLKTWGQIRPGADLEQFIRHGGGSAPCGVTLPVAFGVVCAASGVPLRSALEGFFYTRLAASISGAMRLIPIGQHEAHALLAEILEGIPAAVDMTLACDGPCAFAPALDLAAMSQQYVYSRLFRS